MPSITALCENKLYRLSDAANNFHLQIQLCLLSGFFDSMEIEMEDSIDFINIQIR